MDDLRRGKRTAEHGPAHGCEYAPKGGARTAANSRRLKVPGRDTFQPGTARHHAKIRRTASPHPDFSQLDACTRLGAAALLAWYHDARVRVAVIVVTAYGR